MHTCTYDGVRKHVCMDNVICTVPGCLCSESVRLQQALVKSHSLTDPSPEVVASRSPLEERMITDHVTGGWNIRWMEGCMGEPVGMTFTSHQQLTAEEEEKETMRERERVSVLPLESPHLPSVVIAGCDHNLLTGVYINTIGYGGKVSVAYRSHCHWWAIGDLCSH